MADYEKPHRGDKLNIPAAAWSEMLDMLRWWKCVRAHTGTGDLMRTSLRPSVVQIKNNSDEDRNRFDALGIDESSIFPTPLSNLPAFKNGPILHGLLPEASHRGRFVIIQEPLREGTVGVGIIDGVTVAQVNFVNAADKWADVEAGQVHLKSGQSGSAKILCQPASAGLQWTLLLLGGASGEPVGGCLAEDHPGRGIAFDLRPGTWNSAARSWTYNTSATVKAIDHRYGVPYPAAGATGLFWIRPDDEYGEIWEVESLDCVSPGACGS